MFPICGSNIFENKYLVNLFGSTKNAHNPIMHDKLKIRKIVDSLDEGMRVLFSHDKLSTQ